VIILISFSCDLYDLNDWVVLGGASIYSGSFVCLTGCFNLMSRLIGIANEVFRFLFKIVGLRKVLTLIEGCAGRDKSRDERRFREVTGLLFSRYYVDRVDCSFQAS